MPLLPGFGVSPYSLLPVMVFLFHWSWWTFYTAVGCIALSILLAKLGYPFSVLIAAISNKLRGNRIYARPWWYRNRYVGRGR
jgi:intracellular multiplication protein IcmT